MKKKLTILLAFLCLFLLAGCKKRGNAIVGTWNVEIEQSGMAVFYEYVFNKDKTMKISMLGGSVSIKGTYEIVEDTLIMTTEPFGEIRTTEATFEIQGDTLLMTEQNRTLQLTRKK